MRDIRTVYSLTANFPSLQGFKSIPIALWLLLIVLWANQEAGNSNLFLPIVISISMMLFLWFVSQYYRLAFGTVQRTKSRVFRELIFSAIAVLLALAAFWLDTAYEWPVSYLGLLFAGVMAFDYFRLRKSLSIDNFPYPLIFSLFLLVLSVLPVLGMENWWLIAGIATQLFAILIAVSLVMILSGVLWHWFLVRNLKIGDR
jgi:hypothetical protein